MKKIIILIICFFIISCSVKNDEKIENNSGKAEIEKENSFPYSKIMKIKLDGEDDANWKNTLEFLFSKSNSLIVEIDKKEDLNDLNSIGNNKFYSLSFEISEKDIFGKEFLKDISKTNGEILTFNIKNENIKRFEISDEEKEIFKSLNFKTKNIFVNGKEINL